MNSGVYDPLDDQSQAMVVRQNLNRLRTPPNSDEAEKGVLGSVMCAGDDLRLVMEDVRARLPDPFAFYNPVHRMIYERLIAAYEAGKPVDVVTVTTALRDEGILEMVGGPVYLTHLFTFVPTHANVEHYADIVREKWMLRQLIAHCTSAVSAAYDEQGDPRKVLDDLQSNVVEIGQYSTSADPVKHIKEFVDPAMKQIESYYEHRGGVIGLPSGFIDLDRMTKGFQAPLTYYFAGRPAMGKSSVMIEVANHIAISNAAKGNNVGIFSIEMTGIQIVKRLICMRANLNLGVVNTSGTGFMSQEKMKEISEEAGKIRHAHIHIDETGNLSILDFRARARRGVVKHEWKLIIIDYIQRMHSTSHRAKLSREQEINEIAQGISATAKELNIPIIVLAQINRKSEDRADKIPQLSDLRESGSMEQEAKFVGLLHRPSYYAKSQEKLEKMAKDRDMDVDEFRELAYLLVAKQNDGPDGQVTLRFVREFARLENPDDRRLLYSEDPERRQQLEDSDE